MLKCVSEGKICARNGPGVVGNRKVLSSVSFRIGAVERVNMLKSKALFQDLGGGPLQLHGMNESTKTHVILAFEALFHYGLIINNKFDMFA
jgi:hypothetical protein